MAQFLVRDVPDDVAAALKKRAKKNGRSTEAELRAILAETVKPKVSEFWKEADRLRKELSDRGLKFDSAAVIREERDKR